MKITKIATITNKQQNLQKNTSSPIERQAQQKNTSFLSNISFSGYTTVDYGYSNYSTSGCTYTFNNIDVGDNKELKEIKTLKAVHNYDFVGTRKIYHLDIDEGLDMNKIPKDTNYVVQYKQPENHKFGLLKESALNPKDYFSLNYDNHIKYLSLWRNQIDKYRSKSVKKQDAFDNTFAKDVMDIQIKSNDEKLSFIDKKMNIYNNLNNNTSRIKTCVDLQINYNKTLVNIENQKKQIATLEQEILKLTNQKNKIEQEQEQKIKELKEKIAKSTKEEKAECKLELRMAEVANKKIDDTILANLRFKLANRNEELSTVRTWLRDSLAYIDKVDASDDFKNRETIISNSLKNIKNIYQEHFPECLE